jgi:competence ComEA-like helix-hairpin-helix protein
VAVESSSSTIHFPKEEEDMKATRWIGMAVLGTWCLAGGAVATEDKPAKSGQRVEARPESKGEVGEIKVNINAASKVDLMKLDGVGAGAAQKIIAYRQANGPFKRPQDLAKVDGLSKSVLEKNAGRITVK